MRLTTTLLSLLLVAFAVIALQLILVFDKCNKRLTRVEEELEALHHKHLCDRRYKEIVQPQEELNAQSIRQFLASGFSRFEKECALKEYVSFTKTELTRIMKTKEELEQKQKQLEIETEKRKTEEDKRIKAEDNFKKYKEKMEKDLQDEKDRRLARVEQEVKLLHYKNEQILDKVDSLEEQIHEFRNISLKRLQEDDGNFILKIVKTALSYLGMPKKIVQLLN